MQNCENLYMVMVQLKRLHVIAREDSLGLGYF